MCVNHCCLAHDVRMPQGEQPLNVLSAGCFGDGQHDETKALQAAISSARTVFIPFGIYMVSAPIILRPDSRIVGEGYSILRMMPNSFKTNQALLTAPPGSSSDDGVALADLSLWNADCGNEAGLMLAWEAGPASSMHDVNMLVSVSISAT